MTDAIDVTTGLSGGNPRRGIWPLSNTNMLKDALEVCRTTPCLGLISGPSGSGKTTAAQAVVDAHSVGVYEEDYVQAYRIMMTRAAETLHPGLLRIGNAIGAHVTRGMGASGAHEVIVEHIYRWRRGSLLVLDEAQFMTDELIDAIRNIADELAECGRMPGIVLMGDKFLAGRIEGRIGKRPRMFEPLRGRLGVKVALDGLAPEDYGVMARAMDLDDSHTAEFFGLISSRRGGMHNVAIVLKTARNIAGPGVKLTLAHLRLAAQVSGVMA